MNPQSLFELAREDGPDARQKDAGWEKIALATGAAGTATVANGAATKALFAKLVVLGALVSGLGVAAVFAATTGDAPLLGAATVSRPAHHAGSRIAMHASASSAAPRTLLIDDLEEAPAASSNVESDPAAAIVPEPILTSDLAEEARIVTDARAALVDGDAARALELVRSTRKWSTRAMEPEELAIEARAMKALGRVDEAAAADIDLKARYPHSALAR